MAIVPHFAPRVQRSLLAGLVLAGTLWAASAAATVIIPTPTTQNAQILALANRFAELVDLPTPVTCTSQTINGWFICVASARPDPTQPLLVPSLQPFSFVCDSVECFVVPTGGVPPAPDTATPLPATL